MHFSKECINLMIHVILPLANFHIENCLLAGQKNEDFYSILFETNLELKKYPQYKVVLAVTNLWCDAVSNILTSGS